MAFNNPLNNNNRDNRDNFQRVEPNDTQSSFYKKQLDEKDKYERKLG